MATAGSLPPASRTYGPRMCRAVVDLGGDIMRDALCHKINPRSILSGSTGCRLNAQQLAVIGGAQSRGDYNECDITLLYTLLRNCTATNTALRPTNGWGISPAPSDVTLGDDLERIRLMRNEVHGHVATTSIPLNIYTICMKEMEDICHRMDTVHKGQLTRLSRTTWTYSQMLNEIQICCMDSDMEAKYIEEIRRLKEEDQKREKDIQSVTERLHELSTQSVDVAEDLRMVQNTTASLQEQNIEHGQRIDILTLNIQQQANTLAEYLPSIVERVTSKRNETEKDKKASRKILLEKYENVTQCVIAMPLDDTSMPLDQLYSPVIVAEDSKSQSKSRKEDRQTDRKSITMSDMFLIDGKPVKRIFMKGEAGRGKTVFTIKLVADWCKVQQGQQSDMQEVLSQFDLTFYVSMRYVKKKRNKVVDMICDCLSEGDREVVTLFRRVLCNRDIPCLVILDGLDEWSSSSNTFPDTYGLVNCILFTSTRPWKLEKLQMSYTSQDKVVKILGIDPGNIQALITRIVTHLCKNDNQNLENKLTTCIQRSEEPMLKSLLTLPMILTAACHVWCEEDKDITHGKSEHVSNSMTYFILSIPDLLIKRGEQKNKQIGDHLQRERKKQDRLTQAEKKRRNDQTQQSTSGSSDMMILLCRFFPYINHFIDILTPFFKLAYDDLLSREPLLVFEKYQLEGEIGIDRVDLALKVGIISQCRAPGCFNIQNVSVSFPHKLIQELMAAMYIICNPDMLQEFCNHCNSIDKIMELGNVIMFVSGLDRSLGGKLSHHVVRKAQTDEGLILYRQAIEGEHISKLLSLYPSQCEWYREMVHVSAMIGNTHLPSYHVSDVFLWCSDNEVVRLTGELMSNNNHTIMSVYLCMISDISSIIQYLPNHSTSLLALRIMDCDVQDRELLIRVLPQLKQLQCIQYGGSNKDVDAGVIAPVTRLTRLKSVGLNNITLGYTILSVSHMTQLETLVLRDVYMSAGGWEEFLSSLLSIPHKVKVTLQLTNIDDDSITMIKSSPKFTLIAHDTDILGDTTEFYKET